MPQPNGTHLPTANKNAGSTTPKTSTGPPRAHRTKTHQNNPTRHHYRPKPRRRNFNLRYCLCRTCFWSIVLLIVLLLVAAIAAAAFYFLYKPQPPFFSVTAVKISRFNLITIPSDDSTHLTTRINVTLSARNPNKRIEFLYNPLSISVLWNSVVLTNGSFTNFTNSPESIYVIHSAMGLNSQVLDAGFARSIGSDLRKKNGLPMKIHVDTLIGVKVGKMKMKKTTWIRVECDGIRWAASSGRNVKSPSANSDNAKCKVDLRVNIWKLFSF